jgi:flagellar hook-basal body protein
MFDVRRVYMLQSLGTAVSGLRVAQQNLDTTANNLANVNTVGFRAARTDFSDMFYRNFGTAGSFIPVGKQVGSGATLEAITRSFQQGSTMETGRNLDFQVKGDGFFNIEGSRDPATGKPTILYTRNGTFYFSPGEGPAKGKQGTPSAQEGSEAARQRGSEAARQRGSEAARQRGSEAARQRGSEAARQRGR